MGGLDALLIAGVAALAALAAWYAVRHGTGCDGCCARCPYRRTCRRKKKNG